MAPNALLKTNQPEPNGQREKKSIKEGGVRPKSFKSSPILFLQFYVLEFQSGYTVILWLGWRNFLTYFLIFWMEKNKRHLSYLDLWKISHEGGKVSTIVSDNVSVQKVLPTLDSPLLRMLLLLRTMMMATIFSIVQVPVHEQCLTPDILVTQHTCSLHALFFWLRISQGNPFSMNKREVKKRKSWTQSEYLLYSRSYARNPSPFL